MEYSLLGRSGMRVSKVCIGTATFGAKPVGADAEAVIHAALDTGINFIDTANSYGHMPKFSRPDVPDDREAAEEIVGRALQRHRDEVVLATKAREPIGPGVNDEGLSRKHLYRQIETSLRRLRTDYVDLYYAHHPDPDTPLDETLRALDDLVRQGKVRCYALSTYPAWEMTHAIWLSREYALNAPVCAQVRYNVVDRTVETEIVPACQHFGLSIVSFSSLHGGLLAGEQALASGYVGWTRWGREGFTDADLATARRFYAVCRDWGLAPNEVALAWLLSRPTVASAIIGPVSAAEVVANAKAVSLTLDAEQLVALETITDPPE